MALNAFMVSQVPVPDVYAGQGGRGFYTPSTFAGTERNTNFLGQEFTVLDPKYKQPKTIRIVMNDTGLTLLPGELVELSTTDGEFGLRAGALCSAPGVMSWPVDDNVPSSGVPNGSWFCIVMEGLNLVITPATGVTLGEWAVGARLTGQTAGRAIAFDPNLSTTTQSNRITSIIGKAMTARTSGNTSTNTLCWIRHP